MNGSLTDLACLLARRHMSRKHIIAFLLPLFVSACGGVADNRGINVVAVVLKSDGVPVIGEPIDISFGNLHQKVVTDSNGEAKATFTYMWGGLFLVIPPLGYVPRRSGKPGYSVLVRGKAITIPSDSSATAYDSQIDEWKTTMRIDLKE